MPEDKLSWKISKEDMGVPWTILGTIAFVSVLMAIYFTLSENYFAATLFVIAPAAIIITATQGPQEFSCQIDEKGIKMNKKEYRFSDIEYFSIIGSNLAIRPKEQRNHIYIPISYEIAEEIKDIVSEQVEEKDFDESLTDIAVRVLRIH